MNEEENDGVFVNVRPAESCSHKKRRSSGRRKASSCVHFWAEFDPFGQQPQRVDDLCIHIWEIFFYVHKIVHSLASMK